jgi:hypothetical protein
LADKAAWWLEALLPEPMVKHGSRQQRLHLPEGLYVYRIVHFVIHFVQYSSWLQRTQLATRAPWAQGSCSLRPLFLCCALLCVVQVSLSDDELEYSSAGRTSGSGGGAGRGGQRSSMDGKPGSKVRRTLKPCCRFRCSCPTPVGLKELSHCQRLPLHTGAAAHSTALDPELLSPRER